MKYPLIFSKYANQPLLATPQLVKSAVSLLFGNAVPSAISTEKTQNLINKVTEIRGDIGILNITGPIFRYGKIDACDVVYGTQHYSEEFARLDKDPSISHIIINFDTGGGEAAGIAELARQINESDTPTTAYVDGMAASAGYWLASACNRIVAADTAFLGSIGVVFAWLDTTKMMDKIGIEEIEIVSSVSPKKRPDVSSDDGRAQVQVWADDLADIFVSSVASYRGVQDSTVLRDFGQGDVMIASKAIKFGMVDAVSTFEKLILEIKGENMPKEEENQAGAATATIVAPAALEEGVATETQINDAVLAERSRIQSIYAVMDKHYPDLAVKHMFEATSDVKDYIFDLHQAKQDAISTAKTKFDENGKSIADKLGEISTAQDGSGMTQVKKTSKLTDAMKKKTSQKGDN